MDLIEKRSPQEKLIIAKTLIESVLDELPSARPTLYGYNLELLSLIASVMAKKGISPEEAVEIFTDIRSVYQMVVEEQKEIAKGVFEQWMTPEKTQLSGEDATKDATLDCISRKVAIDAIEQYLDRFDAIDANFLDGLKTAINIVKELPSERIGIKFEEVKDNPAYSRYLFESIPSAHPEPEHTMEEFMYGQDLGSPEDGSL